MALTDGERRALLQELSDIATDADAMDDERVLEGFLPLEQHRRAMASGTLVIRGERGTGKTALFRFLGALVQRGYSLSSVYPEVEQEPKWVEGLAETGTLHPGTMVLDALAANLDEESLRLFWFGHLLGRLCEGLELERPDFLDAWANAREDVQCWLPAVRTALPRASSWLDQVEAQLDGPVWVTYDHLDKIGTLNRQVRERYARTLLNLWLSLGNRYRRLRAKIFLREDLFQASQRQSADASKLDSRSTTLTWDRSSLYRVLIRRMAARSPDLRNWLQAGAKGIPLSEHLILGYLPPESLPTDGRCSQRGLAEHLAGSQMGRGIKKGYVHRWLISHLQDGHGAVFPRSLLTLVAKAASFALRNGPKARYTRLLHPTELQQALVETSRQRVAELKNEHLVVERLEKLEGLVVMASRREVQRRLGGEARDGLPDGEAAFEELERLGVLRIREDGRVDVPDLYRYGYGIKRKGGVAAPK